MFASSVSDVYPLFLFLLFASRSGGSALCYVSFLLLFPHICHEDWFASRHVEDMNLDVEYPTLWFQFFCRSSNEREESNLGLLDWTGFSVCFCFLAFLTSPILLVLGTGLASSLYWRTGG